MELIPSRSHYAAGQEVVIELSEPVEADSQLVVSWLHRDLRTINLPAGSSMASLGRFDPGGYGVRLGAEATAFDVLSSPFERPRYGFVARLGGDVDVQAVTRNFRRLHLNLAQLYDWAYRHSRLLPPTRLYVDPLGQERDLAVVNQMSRGLSEVGTVPLGYSAVYAIGSDEVAHWPDSLLLRSDGEPYRLGDNFLVLVDPSEPAWLEHYLEQLSLVIEGTSIAGFHLDQYGWPKFARRSDGTRVDLAESFAAMLAAVRERLPAVPFMFNNVNDFPTYATATSPQDATYIEVWDPHSTLQDLASLASSARALRPAHPPILSAYLSCYRGVEQMANAAAALVMATVWSHGASHLLLGEDGNALSGPYYPDNHRLQPASVDFFARWYDFQVRYGDLLYDPVQVDVTEFFVGGINEDLVFSGAEFSTKARAGTVWTRVVRTSRGLVVHLVNLVAQGSTEWDSERNQTMPHSEIEVKLAIVDPGTTIYFVDVDSSPTMVPLTPAGIAVAQQVNALSAGQASVSYRLPTVGTWAMLFIPDDQLT